MDEFVNRIEAQRSVLRLVNKSQLFNEQLCGLSRNAIERWILNNSLQHHSSICQILYRVSDKLSFLATKSQEQVTNEYRLLVDQVNNIIFNLKSELGKLEEARNMSC